MPRSSSRNSLHIGREYGYLIAAGVIFSISYFLFLYYQNTRAAAYLEEMRTTSPEDYLSEIRKLEGFSTYLAEFRMLKDYRTPKLTAPIFIVGRWTLRQRIERIPVGSEPECTDPIVFEYGHVKVPSRNLDLAVLYSLEDNVLTVHPDAGVPFDVRIVSYAASIDHLELTVPGTQATSYAYRCLQ